VGDEPENINENRRRVEQLVGGPVGWMGLVHGVDVVDMDTIAADAVPKADAQVSHGAICSVTTADCLPLLLCDKQGTVVAAAHAGWRGLCAGIIEFTVASMQTPAEQLLVYLGPAIGPNAFEVGPDVRDAFLGADPARSVAPDDTLAAFRPVTGAASKWMADIYKLARNRLVALGVPAVQVFGGTRCTYTEEALFFSHRRATHRAEPTGRMASLIWIDAASR
jgi:YfiH family protein